MNSQHLSDDDLQQRTRELIVAAERISSDLMIQTDRLAAAIAFFQRQIITPLRQELGNSDG